MSTHRIKVGPNDPCPCGERKKYKNCCKGRFDWEQALKQRSPEIAHQLSVRGRNLRFFHRIYDLLQVDTPEKLPSYKQIKSAITPTFVERLHQSILDIWPASTPIEAVLAKGASGLSGLYIGDYQIEHLARGVKRHSLYSNKILLVDPFIYPLSVRPEFNPIQNPAAFRSHTLKSLRTWVTFAKWIEEGLIEFIRTPADFDPRLNWESMVRQEAKYDKSAELQTILKESTEKKLEEFKKRGEARRIFLLGAPDAALRQMYREVFPDTSMEEEENFLSYVQAQREADPLYLERWPGTDSEFHIESTGANFEVAKLTAGITGSYLVTDLPSRWKEIEMDRANLSAVDRQWAPLARAFQSSTLPYLADIRLDHALQLRREGRLEPMRAFMKRVWSSASARGDEFSEVNIQLLADELDLQVRTAREEWKQIDRDLLKWAAPEMAGAIAILTTTGSAQFAAAAFGAAAISNLAISTSRRKGFADKHPAAFFMNLRDAS